MRRTKGSVQQLIVAGVMLECQQALVQHSKQLSTFGHVGFAYRIHAQPPPFRSCRFQQGIAEPAGHAKKVHRLLHCLAVREDAQLLACHLCLTLDQCQHLQPRAIQLINA